MINKFRISTNINIYIYKLGYNTGIHKKPLFVPRQSIHTVKSHKIIKNEN